MEEPGLVSMPSIITANKIVQQSALCWRTPLLRGMHERLGLKDVELLLKMENMQYTGSFKVRGLVNQLHNLPDTIDRDGVRLVTMSAGNYGKAFAHGLATMGLEGLVYLPYTAPSNRLADIKNLGVDIRQAAHADLQKEVDKCVREQNMHYLHSFDDTHLIEGYGSIALEILEDGVKPDIIVVCCGGGGLVSGVAAAFKQSTPGCRVYAVEPEGACAMYKSFQKGHAVKLDKIDTIATGLSAPYAGQHTYRHCREFVDDVVLVSDAEITAALVRLYHIGIKAEPSGCAGLAALMTGKIPDANGRTVVVVITGGNVTPTELCRYVEVADSAASCKRIT